MIAPYGFGSCRRKLHNIHIFQSKITDGIHGFCHSFQGNTVDHDPYFRIFFQKKVYDILHISGRSANKRMSRSRKFCHGFRRHSRYDHKVIHREFLFIFFQKSKGIFFFLNGINLAHPCTQSHLYRHGTCARTHIIAHRIFGQAKLGERDGTHFLLGHRRFSTKKFSITDPMDCRHWRSLFIAGSHHTQSISTILCKVCRLIVKDLLVFVGKIFSHIERHISHSIIYKPGCQYSHSVFCSENRKYFWIMAYQGDQITVPSMSTDDLRVIPGKTDLRHKIYHRRNSADHLNIAIQLIDQLLRTTVKSHIAGKGDRHRTVLRMFPDVLHDLFAPIFMKNHLTGFLHCFGHTFRPDKKFSLIERFFSLQRQRLLCSHADSHKRNLLRQRKSKHF